MVATSHPLSSLVGLEVLRAGGNAMDAAIAACALQCVVEPQSTGIGGDCFALYAAAGSSEVQAINGSGYAPAGLSSAWLLEQGITKIERGSPHCVTLPGAVDAWEKLNRRFGRMSLGELLQPAIAYAREGYPVAQRVHRDWESERAILERNPAASARFLPGGEVPALGSLHRQPELADTLALIAEEGRDAFYKGAVAEDIVEALQSLGGRHELSDFAEYESEWVTPISSSYRGWEVMECPPNGQGIVALALLNILERFDLASLDPLSVERAHLEIEAARLAYQDRAEWLGDPAFSDQPMELWLDKARAAARAASIDPARRAGELPPTGLPEHKDTVYIAVVDKERNCASFINTLFASFGSGILAPRSGVMLTNRACGFVVDPAHPNGVQPRKRPAHTIIPGLLRKDGRPVMPFGVMGGQYQACGHAHLLSNMLDFGMDPQAAIDQPRLFPNPASGLVEIESGYGPEQRAGLEALGHSLTAPPKPIGGAQAIWIDWETGVLTGGSDPRKDGCALGY
jgi:gamma-glutamyltranspeptidase/glutathione hydrolase